MIVGSCYNEPPRIRLRRVSAQGTHRVTGSATARRAVEAGEEVVAVSRLARARARIAGRAQTTAAASTTSTHVVKAIVCTWALAMSDLPRGRKRYINECARSMHDEALAGMSLCACK